MSFSGLAKGGVRTYLGGMTSSHKADINDAQFATEVVKRSESQPVLVDFWAPWCGPCRMLGPVLEKLAEEMGGAFFLAKINTEECQQVASSYRISGIPAVKLFVDGKVIAEFTGALPESQVREFLNTHLPSEAAEALAQAHSLVASGQLEAAEAAFLRGLQLDASLHEARIGLARLWMKMNKTEGLEELLSPIGKLDTEREAADAILQLKDFASACSTAGGTTAIEASLENGDGAEACLRMGQCLAVQGEYEQALDHLLRSVKADNHHAEDAARKAMLVVFQITGIHSDLSNQYRRQLSIYS